MNTLELTKKISESNSITAGRSEMIVSIIFERLAEKIKKNGEVSISGFGTFRVESKKPISTETMLFAKNYIIFSPDKLFLEKINS